MTPTGDGGQDASHGPRAVPDAGEGTDANGKRSLVEGGSHGSAGATEQSVGAWESIGGSRAGKENAGGGAGSAEGMPEGGDPEEDPPGLLERQKRQRVRALTKIIVATSCEVLKVRLASSRLAVFGRLWCRVSRLSDCGPFRLLGCARGEVYQAVEP